MHSASYDNGLTTWECLASGVQSVVSSYCTAPWMERHYLT
jgi:hypothetical protein